MAEKIKTFIESLDNKQMVYSTVYFNNQEIYKLKYKKQDGLFCLINGRKIINLVGMYITITGPKLDDPDETAKDLMTTNFLETFLRIILSVIFSTFIILLTQFFLYMEVKN